MLFRKDKSIHKSIDVPCTVHGVVVKKLPVARYLLVMESMTNPIGRILESVFKGEDSPSMLEKLQHLDKDALQKLMVRVIMAAPAELVRLCGELLEIPQERLTQEVEGALTLTELVDVLVAFWEKNDLSGFFEKGRALMMRISNPNPKTGSNEFLPLD